MEVKLLDAGSLPEGCLLSVRAGSTRRQALAEPKKLKLQFPKSMKSADPFKVDLLAPIATAVINLPFANHDHLEVKFPSEGKKKAPWVTLHVRDTAVPASAEEKHKQGVNPINVAGSEATGVKGAMDLGLPDGKDKLESDGTAGRRHRAALSARNYLDDHKLLSWAQVLFQDLIRMQPEDPWMYIEKHTNWAKQESKTDKEKKIVAATAAAVTEQVTGAAAVAAAQDEVVVQDEVSANSLRQLAWDTLTRASADGSLVKAAEAWRQSSMVSSAAPAAEAQRTKDADDDDDDDEDDEETEDVMALRTSIRTSMCEGHKDGRLEQALSSLRRGDDEDTRVITRSEATSSRAMVCESALALQGGDFAHVPSLGDKGEVLNRTTTEVLLRMSSGKEEWHNVEDLAKAAVGAKYELREGDRAVLPHLGQTGLVLARTTTEIQLATESGEKIWYPIEEVDVEALDKDGDGGLSKEEVEDALEKGLISKELVQAIDTNRDGALSKAEIQAHAMFCLTAHELKVGDVAHVPKQLDKGEVLNRTTTDILLRMSSGKEEWHDVEDLAKAAVGAKYELREGDVAAVPSLGTTGVILSRTTTELELEIEDGAKVVRIWYPLEEIDVQALDQDGDGELSKKEVDDALEKGLISKELVRAVDADGDGALSKAELEAHAMFCLTAHELKIGDIAHVPKKFDKGEVLNRTTTDVLLKMSSGKDEWHDVEDLSKAAVGDKYELREGERAVVASSGDNGLVLARTTTEFLLETNRGAKIWYPIEEIDVETLDQDGDGGLNKKEVDDALEKGLISKELVQAVDTDGDGALSKAELAAHAMFCLTAHELKAGDVAHVPKQLDTGEVLNRTTTEVLLRMSSGKDEWHDVEDLSKAAVGAKYELREGDRAVLPHLGQTGLVLARTTTEIQLQTESGEKIWYPIEEIDVETLDKDGDGGLSKKEVDDALEQGLISKELVQAIDTNRDGALSKAEIQAHAMFCQTAHDLKVGDVAHVPKKLDKGEVLNRTTTDVLLRMSSGKDEWHDVEDLAKAAVGAKYELHAGERAVVSESSEMGIILVRTTTEIQLETKNGEKIWYPIEEIDVEALDQDGDGELSKKEIDDGVQQGLISRKLVEAVDTNRDGTLSKAELQAHKLLCESALSLKVGDLAHVPRLGAKGRVRRRTTTDVLLELEGGKEQWCEVEDLLQAAEGGAHDLKPGDRAVVPHLNLKGIVLSRNTTDVQLQMEQGERAWHAVEDLDVEEVSQMKMTIEGINYDQLVSNPTLVDSVKAEIKRAVVEEAGNQIKESSVQVELSKGSVVATVKIFEPTTDQLKPSSNLMSSVVTKVSAVPGINAVKSGPIVISKATLEVNSVGAEMARQQSPPSKTISLAAEVEAEEAFADETAKKVVGEAEEAHLKSLTDEAARPNTSGTQGTVELEEDQLDIADGSLRQIMEAKQAPGEEAHVKIPPVPTDVPTKQPHKDEVRKQAHEHLLHAHKQGFLGSAFEAVKAAKSSPEAAEADRRQEQADMKMLEEELGEELGDEEVVAEEEAKRIVMLAESHLKSNIAEVRTEKAASSVEGTEVLSLTREATAQLGDVDNVAVDTVQRLLGGALEAKIDRFTASLADGDDESSVAAHRATAAVGVDDAASNAVHRMAARHLSAADEVAVEGSEARPSVEKIEHNFLAMPPNHKADIPASATSIADIAEEDDISEIANQAAAVASAKSVTAEAVEAIVARQASEADEVFVEPTEGSARAASLEVVAPARATVAAPIEAAAPPAAAKIETAAPPEAAPPLPDKGELRQQARKQILETHEAGHLKAAFESSRPTTPAEALPQSWQSEKSAAAAATAAVTTASAIATAQDEAVVGARDDAREVAAAADASPADDSLVIKSVGEAAAAQIKADKAVAVAAVVDELAEQAAQTAAIEKAHEVVAAADLVTTLNAFDEADRNKDGVLDQEELVDAQAMLEKTGSSCVAAATKSHEDLDANNDGVVSQEEFIKDVGETYLQEKAQAAEAALVEASAKKAQEKAHTQAEEADKLAATLKAKEAAELEATMLAAKQAERTYDDQMKITTVTLGTQRPGLQRVQAELKDTKEELSNTKTQLEETKKEADFLRSELEITRKELEDLRQVVVSPSSNAAATEDIAASKKEEDVADMKKEVKDVMANLKAMQS